MIGTNYSMNTYNTVVVDNVCTPDLFAMTVPSFNNAGESLHNAIYLDLNAVEGADYYVISMNDGTNTKEYKLLDAGAYSFYGLTQNVTYNVIMTAPTLGVKENEGTLQVTVPEIEGAGRYVVEVSTDESFSNVVRAESTESGDIMIEGLDIRTTYYVRTCAMNMDASGEPTNYTNWSELVNVEVGPIGTLAAPGLTAEADGYSFTGAFTAVENAVEYVLSYSTDSTFQENVESITLTPEEIANGFSIDGAAGTTYYVKGYAVGDDENYVDSLWTEVAEVTTDPALAITVSAEALNPNAMIVSFSQYDKQVYSTMVQVYSNGELLDTKEYTLSENQILESILIEGLEPLTEYQLIVQVSADNVTGITTDKFELTASTPE